MESQAGEKPQEATDHWMPVILDFVPINAALNLINYSDDLPSRSISMTLRLNGDEVRTPDDRSLTHAGWQVQLFESDLSNDHVRSLGAMGMLNHCPASDDYEYGHDAFSSLWAHVGAESFAALRAVIMSGRLPASLRVHVKGMDYGWSPDGSEKIWDVGKNPNATVHKIEIACVLVQTPKGNDDEGEVADDGSRPVTAADLHALERVVLALPQAIAQTQSYLGWAVALLAVLVVLMFFR